MSRRRVTAIARCAKPGCLETAYFEYDSQRERAEAEKRRAESPWRCTRHLREDEVLSPANLERVAVLTAAKVFYQGKPIKGLFWKGPGLNSGLTIGPGFKAFADDFPEGTQLVITARVDLPTPPGEAS